MKRIKVFCHTCEGKKNLEDKRYPDGKIIMVPCPECNGEGWVWEETKK
jgi:DnaJ-class molecular chaperone